MLYKTPVMEVLSWDPNVSIDLASNLISRNLSFFTLEFL